MRIVVCAKEVPDPEAPASAMRVDTAKKTMVYTAGTSRVLSPYCENALEAALQIKDQVESHVTLLSLGPESVKERLIDALGAGADEAILLSDPAFNEGDSFATGVALASAIKKLGQVDLVFCGRQASDTDAGVTGPVIAECLGAPCVTIVRKITLGGDRLRVERITDDGYEILEMRPPAVFTVTSEMYTLRYSTVMGIMAASQKEVTVWGAADLGLEPQNVGAGAGRTSLLTLAQPTSNTQCQFIEGETPEELAAGLVAALRSNKII